VRKFVLGIVLLSLVLISAGCGQTKLIGAGTEEPTEKGMVTIIARRSDAPKEGLGTLEAIPNEATHLRVRLTNAFRSIVDEAAFDENNEAKLTIVVPVGTYEAHVVAYKVDFNGASGAVLIAGVTPNVEIKKGEKTTVNVKLNRLAYSGVFTYPTDEVDLDSLHKIELREAANTLNGLKFADDFKMISSDVSWAGDTQAGQPQNVTKTDVTKTTDTWEVVHSVELKAPNRVNSAVYFQWYRQLEDGYNDSTVPGLGKTGLVPLYAYIPTAHFDGVAMLKTYDAGSVEIIIDEN